MGCGRSSGRRAGPVGHGGAREPGGSRLPVIGVLALGWCLVLWSLAGWSPVGSSPVGWSSGGGSVADASVGGHPAGSTGPAGLGQSGPAGPTVTQSGQPAGGSAPTWGQAVPGGPASWPLAGPRRVGRPFAPGPTRYSAGHYGADLPASAGQPVRAAKAGRVSFAGRVAGRGVVVVSHGRLRTTYEPVLPTVRVGMLVEAGDTIGRLTRGHPSCGPARVCLHWGLRRGIDYLDPVLLVRRGPVVLLPVARVRADAGQGAVHTRRTGAALNVSAEPSVRRPDVFTAESSPPTDAHPVPASTRVWSLRKAETQQGAAALAALLAGVALLRRPRPLPPTSGAAGGAMPPPVDPVDNDGVQAAQAVPVHAGSASCHCGSLPTGRRTPSEPDAAEELTIDLAQERSRRRHA